MSLQRRLLLYLLICAPVVWGVALLASAQRARHERRRERRSRSRAVR